MDTCQILLIFIYSTAAFIIKGVAGFGDPLISTPLLSTFLTTDTITPGMTITSTVLNAGIVIMNRKFFSAKVVLPISAFMVLGIIPGTFLLKRVPSQGLKLVLGLAIVGLGLEMLLRKPDRSTKPNFMLMAIFSFFSGLMAGIYNINMLFLVYVQRVAGNRDEFRTNACFVFFIGGIFSIIMYVLQGMIGKEELILTAVSLPASLLGMKIGGLLDKRISDARSKQIIIFIFLIMGISTALYAAVQLWR